MAPDHIAAHSSSHWRDGFRFPLAGTQQNSIGNAFDGELWARLPPRVSMAEPGRPRMPGWRPKTVLDTLPIAMKRWILPVTLGAVGALALLTRSLGQGPAQSQPAAGAAPAARTAIRITFGERQERPTDYSGRITLSEGQVTE